MSQSLPSRRDVAGEVMADKTSPGSRTVAKIALTDEQRQQIQKATGVDLRTIEVLELTGEASRVLAPQLLKGTVVVCCW
jgi:hypothetical protein